MFDEVLLPNGKVAECVADIDAFLKESGLARCGDFGGEYCKNMRRKNLRLQRQSAFEDFIKEYKKRIWNE